MLNIAEKRYRSKYAGEDIITERYMEGGQWHETTEHVDNKVINNQISNVAVVFGNGESRTMINPQKIIGKKSGLLGAKAPQTYGCNAFYRDHTPDFMVCTDRILAKEMVDSGFTNDNIVYTHPIISLEFPGKFYMIPNDPYANAGATAAYIACFDGHRKVYLLGCEGQDGSNYNNNVYAGSNGYSEKSRNMAGAKYSKHFAEVMSVYDDVDFILVTKSGRYPMPSEWVGLTNVRQMSLREMVVDADL